MRRGGGGTVRRNWGVLDVGGGGGGKVEGGGVGGVGRGGGGGGVEFRRMGDIARRESGMTIDNNKKFILRTDMGKGRHT